MDNFSIYRSTIGFPRWIDTISMAIFVIFPSIHNPSKFLITRFFLNFDNFPISSIIYHHFSNRDNFWSQRSSSFFFHLWTRLFFLSFFLFSKFHINSFHLHHHLPFLIHVILLEIDHCLPSTNFLDWKKSSSSDVNNENTFRSLYSKKKEEEISNSLLVIPPRTKPFIFPGKYDVKTFRPSLDYNPNTALIMKLTLSLPLCSSERKGKRGKDSRVLELLLKAGVRNFRICNAGSIRSRKAWTRRNVIATRNFFVCQ